MASRRCSACGICWPGSDTRCAICGENTWFSPSSDPISNEEADRLKAHAAFERWLATPEGMAADEKARRLNDEREAEFAAIAQRLGEVA